MALGAFDCRISTFEPSNVVEDTNLTESMTTIYNSMSESKKTLTNVAPEHMGELLFPYRFLNEY